MANRRAPERMRILVVSSLVAALLILLRFATIMLIPDNGTESKGGAPALAERGSIMDRNGRIIALQTRLWSVAAWKPDIENPALSASLLAPILDEDVDELTRMLASPEGSRFLFIKRQVTPTQSDAIRELIDAGKISGISLQEELGRHYPMKELAAPLIGYVGTDNVGLDGVEYAFDRVLAPGRMTSDGERLYGHSVYLTLDMDTQYLVERIAAQAYEVHLPDSLMILVMDARNAEILSWVSLPSFDPNTFTESSRNQRINRPLTVAYEPGSVFKVFTWATFLNSGLVDTNAIFNTSGGYEPQIFQQFGIQPITDLGNYGVLDVPGALIHSSNVAVAMASDFVEPEYFYKSLKNFGFGTPTGLPLPGESHGLLNGTSNWSPRSKPTIAIGQEVGVSAVQIAGAATTLANGGVLLQPRIVRKVTAVDNSLIKNYPRKPVREVISPRTAQTILKLMEQTVTSPSGTARLAAVPGLRISAKSGTAQITNPETGKYSTDRFLSSVLAIFPTDDPRLIVYVVLENPQGESIYGAQTAAPVVRDIAETLSPLYGIPFAGSTVIEHSGRVRIDNPTPEALGETLHDLTGYSKRMLLPYLRREDITWNIEGEGWVVFQFPPPGTPVVSGMSIFVELR